MDSETIAQGCKRGDPAAQAALYRRFRPVLWRVVTRYVPDPARAEDLLHDAFLLAYTHIGQLRDDARLEAWLVRLARNLALLHLRQTATTATLPLDETNALEQPAESGEATGQPTFDELLELVGRLPEGYRNVFRLHVLDGLSHEEIAARLHISAHTSSSQLLRARRLLQRWLAGRRLPLLLVLLLLSPAGREVLRRWLLPAPAPRAVPSVPGPPANRPLADGLRPRRSAAPDRLPSPSLPDTAAAAPPAAAPPGPAAPADTAPHTPPLPAWPRPWMPGSADRQQLAEARSARPRWQLSLSVNGLRSDHATEALKLVPPNVASHTPIDSWEELRDIINSFESDESTPPALADIASKNSGPLLEKVRHRPAFSVTLGLRRALRSGWGVGGSMGYTRLTTDFVLGEGAYVLRTQRLHYLGLSLLADRTCYTTPSGRFCLSAAAGATVEIPLRGTETTAYVTDVTVGDSAALRLYPRLQWSLSGSVGLQYRFTPRLSLEFAPTFRFYPDNGSPLRSLYSDRPWQFTVPLSLRWSF